MTRFLSEALQAAEPAFRQGLKRLEAATGHPNHDIRFSAEVMQGSSTKLRELGLDPHDTTAEELYHALQERIRADDKRLNRTLRTLAATHVSAEADAVAGMVHALKELPDSRRCFAVKGSVIKSLLKKQPPKKAMKQLGYRSLDSFLKHETPATMLAAAWLCEGLQWRSKLLDRYRQLKPADFESRSIALVQPATKRWQELAKEAVSRDKHNLLSFRELGAIVFLPLPDDSPAGTITASLCLALHELNEIRSVSTFLKLCQVRADFGKIVQAAVIDEARLNSNLLDRPVPWRLVQRHYADSKQSSESHAFEPHLELEDMVWRPLENSLARIEPHLAFWRGSGHLGLLKDGQSVSFNIVDAATSLCNQLSFEHRVTHYFQNSLWHELLLRYLQPEAVERAVTHELQPALAEELAVQ